MQIQEIRDEFTRLYRTNTFVTNTDETLMLEIVGASFRANEPSLFGKPNYSYIKSEIDWYNTGIRNVDELTRIYGKPVQIWEKVCSKNKRINSNYGWCIDSPDNGDQFLTVAKELHDNPQSRRACMIYTRPSMHVDCHEDGMNDFICTHAVNYFIRNGKVNAVAQMRSNDVVFGYANDYAWQNKVLTDLSFALDLPVGNITWQAASLHVYERHFHLIEDYINERVKHD